MHFIKYYDEQCTYIENRYLWKVLKCLPFSSEVLHGANYDDMFELVVVEVGRPEGHHQVPQANQGAVRVCKEANHHMAIQDGHRCLVPVLRIESCIKIRFKISHQYAILDCTRRGPVEHASAVILHLSLLKVKVLRLVVGDPNFEFLRLLTSVLRLVGRPGNVQMLDPSDVQWMYEAQGVANNTHAY